MGTHSPATAASHALASASPRTSPQWLAPTTIDPGMPALAKTRQHNGLLEAAHTTNRILGVTRSLLGRHLRRWGRRGSGQSVQRRPHDLTRVLLHVSQHKVVHVAVGGVVSRVLFGGLLEAALHVHGIQAIQPHLVEVQQLHELLVGHPTGFARLHFPSLVKLGQQQVRRRGCRPQLLGLRVGRRPIVVVVGVQLKEIREVLAGLEFQRLVLRGHAGEGIVAREHVNHQYRGCQQGQGSGQHRQKLVEIESYQFPMEQDVHLNAVPLLNDTLLGIGWGPAVDDVTELISRKEIRAVGVGDGLDGLQDGSQRTQVLHDALREARAHLAGVAVVDGQNEGPACLPQGAPLQLHRVR
mmetsp:Transcript_1880/g.4212  ORF Transcript_1880/g.4212 Transcript_1880/m.4212 type:complete len:354 (+) Transcript_1880:110-1171(+)